MHVRVLIAEDYAALRADLRALIEAERDLEVVGEACDLRELLPLAAETRPDVILLDLDLPGPHGLAVIRQLAGGASTMQILLLADELDAGLARDALRAGAAGYVVSHDATTTLAAGIRAISQGQLFMDQGVIRTLLAEQPVATPPPGCEALTPRELEVLRLLARGSTNRQAAEALALSVRAVEVHRATLQEKLGLHSRADLVRYAASQQLLEGSEHQ